LRVCRALPDPPRSPVRGIGAPVRSSHYDWGVSLFRACTDLSRKRKGSHLRLPLSPTLPESSARSRSPDVGYPANKIAADITTPRMKASRQTPEQCQRPSWTMRMRNRNPKGRYDKREPDRRPRLYKIAQPEEIKLERPPFFPDRASAKKRRRSFRNIGGSGWWRRSSLRSDL
jgi:hypothetical protein